MEPRRNYYSDKKVINDLWFTMVANARSDVSIFAGDISWIDRDERLIKDHITQGNKVSVICRRPIHRTIEATARLKQHMKKLLNTGADVRYYMEKHQAEPRIRGLFVDRFTPYSQALLVRKMPKLLTLADDDSGPTINLAEFAHGIDRAQGIAGEPQNYNYTGIHYAPPQDIDDIMILQELYDRIHISSLVAFVLGELSLNMSDYVELLSIIPQYSNLTQNDLTVERIHTHDLWATCQVVKNYKFETTKALLDAYTTQQIEPFAPCLAISSGSPRNTVLLPPILERQGDKLVIIDGMHRLYWSTYHAKLSQVTCLVIASHLELPSKPVPLDRVVVRTEKPTSITQSFINFQPDFFRQIDELDKSLERLFNKYQDNVIRIDNNLEESAKIHPAKLGINSAKQSGLDRPIRILFLSASPQDTPQLRIDKEIREITQSLRQAEFRNRFEIEQQWAVRIADLQEYLLRYQPDILHFSGHGSSTNEIILEDETGNVVPVSTSAMNRLFGTLKDNIKCVVLNACYSEVQAKVISEHIDCVIGMSNQISDKAAITFARSFYRALAYGRNLKTAFDLGIGQIDLDNLDETDKPKMLIHPNCYPERIYFS